MKIGEEQLTIVAQADGRYTYKFDAGVCGSVGSDVGWDVIQKMVFRLARTVGVNAVGQPMHTASAEPVQVPTRPASPDVQALRLQCAQLAVQSHVPAHQIADWACGLADRITRRSE